MSVTKRQGSRRFFGSTLPVLLPLYDCARESWQFAADEEILCGAGDACQFRLNREGIAVRHCVFSFRAGTLRIRRLDGRVWLNEVPVSSEAILAPGDILSIGPVTIQVDETATSSVPVPVKVITPDALASSNQHSREAQSILVSPQRTFQTVGPGVTPSFLFAPAFPTSPPPLPPVFLEEYSAKISDPAASLFKERIAELESRARMLQAREQQLKDLDLLIRDRERICIERQSTHDERVQVLGEQKSHLEEHRAHAEMVREQLHQQKLDLERRLRQQTEREHELASQLKSTAQGNALLERTRSDLSARLNEIQQRETQLDQHRRELEELASWINSQKADLQSSTTTIEYRVAELHSKEAALNDTAADLAARQKSIAASEDLLRERDAILAVAEQRFAQASLQITDAETKILEAGWRVAEADAIRIAAEEKSSHSERQIQKAREQLQQVEQSRNELERKRRELEDWQQKSQTEHTLTIHLEEQLAIRAASLEEQNSRLALTQQELDTQRRAMNLQQAALSDQSDALQQRVIQLDHREAALSARASQLADDSSSGTRSVEQLMAIAAERESAIRSRQEAERAMEELEAAKATIADRELALNTRHWEIESRSTELAGRVSKLKAERNAVRANARELNEALSQTHVDVALVREEHQRLLERQATLAEREGRASERENAAQVVLRHAEAEREALQRSNKDLICERNALMQFSQDLNSRASGLTERESTVAQQTEELRSRFHAMTQQSTELQHLENELNLRAAEVHRRVSQFKSEIRDQKRAAADDTVAGVLVDESLSVDSVTKIDSNQQHELSEALQAAESQLNSVQTERDALFTAVRELQRAMLDARDDVEEANRLRADVATHEQTLAALYQTIEERSGQLQYLESRLLHAESRSESLKNQLLMSDSGNTTAAEFVGGTALNLGNGCYESSEFEADLMRQLDALKAQLKSTNDNLSPDENSTLSVQQQNRTIDELRTQNEALLERISELALMTNDRDALVSMTQVDELQAQLTRATEVISDRDDLIRELRMRLSQQIQQSGGTSSGMSIDASELQNEARELDRRASLLDAREEEVRERLRMVSNAEGEVETQRRQLLDARQQLELARTEIHVAMKQHSAVANHATEPETKVRNVDEETSSGSGHSLGGAIFAMEAKPVASVLDDRDEISANAALDLRAELASLFGVSGRNAEKPVQELASTQEIPDTSEPLGASKPVALHFGEDASRTIFGHIDERVNESSASPSSEDSSDDFVRDYMEQLLSRSRTAAGNSLPSELSGGNKTKSSAPSSGGAIRKNWKPRQKVLRRLSRISTSICLAVQ